MHVYWDLGFGIGALLVWHSDLTICLAVADIHSHWHYAFALSSVTTHKIMDEKQTKSRFFVADEQDHPMSLGLRLELV